MPVIKASSLRDLKNRVNIHDVVGRVVTLKKAGGGRFKGLCPFHSEKTPSFNVSADKGFYKCFGCGKAGDVINFVKETEGLQFTEAVEAIAQRFGVTLEYEAGSGGPSLETRSLRQEIFDIHDLAADYYRQAFLAATPHGEFIRADWVKNRRGPVEAPIYRGSLAPVWLIFHPRRGPAHHRRAAPTLPRAADDSDSRPPRSHRGLHRSATGINPRG